MGHLVVNVILIVGHEKLNVEMQRSYGNLMTVLKIPKSGGVSLHAAIRDESALIVLHRSSNWTPATASEYTTISYAPTCTVRSWNLHQESLQQ